MKVPIDKAKLRWLDYEYLNRTIAWNAISEFISFAFPYVSQLKKISIFQKVFMFTTVLG